MQNERQQQTLDDKRITKRRHSKGKRIAIQLIATLVIALICNFLGSIFLDTPKKAFILRDGLRIDRQYEILYEKIALAENLLAAGSSLALTTCELRITLLSTLWRAMGATELAALCSSG